MSNRPEGDEQEAKRLSDYSDAILRGETPDASGIDPEDAALIRELHRSGRSVKPDPQLGRVFWQTLDQITGSAGQSELRHQPRGPAPTIPFPQPTPSTPQAGETTPLFGKAPEEAQAAAAPPVIPLPPKGSRSWRRSAAAIAAALLLFLAVAASLVFFATNQGEDETPTLPVAGQGTTQPTTQVNVVASPTSTPTIPALINDIEGFLIYQNFVEPSSVGKQTPVMELFRQRSMTIPWDGEGMIVLSGCGDRLCSLVLDDQLHLQVTNSEGKSPIMRINDDGWEEALPRVLTNFFRPGDNIVQANLYDLAGDERGTHTPIYILILR